MASAAPVSGAGSGAAGGAGGGAAGISAGVLPLPFAKRRVATEEPLSGSSIGAGGSADLPSPACNKLPNGSTIQHNTICILVTKHWAHS